MEKGYIKIVIEDGKAPSVEAQLVNNTVWMAKWEIARLFHCFNQKIETNLRSIFKNHLLWEKDVSRTYRYTDDKGNERQIVYYNLDVLIFLSYRIASFEAIIFREWVNQALREHLQNEEMRKINQWVWTLHPDKFYPLQ
ncbi:MAG: virulence RhuM family protein [Bacteroidales bacterium]|jgi:hypothetical protein|nr:virulence RhuM family protein [Bacteroidales bacterium]